MFARSTQHMSDELYSAEEDLGSIQTSLKSVPKWYQLASIFLSALIPFSLNDFAVLSWASKQLHFDFGTSALWTSFSGSDAYYHTINAMTIRERLGFAAYALMLLGVVALLKRQVNRSFSSSAARDSDAAPSSSPSTSSTEAFAKVFPGRHHLRKALVLLCICEMLFLLNYIIAESIESPMFQRLTSAMGKDVAIEDAAAAQSPLVAAIIIFVSGNIHVAVQLDIVARLVHWWSLSVALPSVVVWIFRVVANLRSRTVQSQRWFFLNVFAARCLALLLDYVIVGIELLPAVELFVPEAKLCDGAKICEKRTALWLHPLAVSQMFLVATTIVYIGAVNYCYGPSKRSADTRTASTLKEYMAMSTRMTANCVMLPLICAFGVMMFAVGVHIVELFLLWLLTFCLMIWIPIAIDAASCDLMAFFAFLAVLLNEVVPCDGHRLFVELDAMRFGALLFFAQLAITAAFGSLYVVCGSRRTAISAIVAFAGLVWGLLTYLAPRTQPEMHDLLIKLFTAKLMLSDDMSGSPLVVKTILILCAVVVACSAFNASSFARHRLDAHAVRIRRRCRMVPLTTSVCIRKLLYLVMKLVHIVVSAAGGNMILSFLTDFLHAPREVGRVGGFVVCCALFGALCDAAAGQFRFLLRAVGILDPPVVYSSRGAALNSSMRTESSND